MIDVGLGLAAGVLGIGLWAEFWRRTNFDVLEVRVVVVKLLALAVLIGAGGPLVYRYSQSLLLFGLWCASWPLLSAPLTRLALEMIVVRRGRRAWRGIWQKSESR